MCVLAKVKIGISLPWSFVCNLQEVAMYLHGVVNSKMMRKLQSRICFTKMDTVTKLTKAPRIVV